MDKNDNELLKLIPFLEKLVELVSVCFRGFSQNCQWVPLIFSPIVKGFWVTEVEAAEDPGTCSRGRRGLVSAECAENAGLWDCDISPEETGTLWAFWCHSARGWLCSVLCSWKADKSLLNCCGCCAVISVSLCSGIRRGNFCLLCSERGARQGALLQWALAVFML